MRFVTYFSGILLVILAFANPALAQDGGFVSTEGAKYLALAIAVFGGALGQSKVIASAVESIGRNPGAADAMFLPWLFGIAFIESLFILGWLIAAGFIG
ncbi:UNVERIFIED_CONTAM: hypothetical protein GTU68_029429 [Idotea baltica]|nr:hypothetical protein [Idotea baltica]